MDANDQLSVRQKALVLRHRDLPRKALASLARRRREVSVALLRRGDDLESAAQWALVVAARKHVPACGDFGPYAWRWVAYAVVGEARNGGGAIYLPGSAWGAGRREHALAARRPEPVRPETRTNEAGRQDHDAADALAAVATLEPVLRRALEAYYLDGLGSEEAAAAAGVSRRTEWDRRRRALAAAREKLAA